MSGAEVNAGYEKDISPLLLLTKGHVDTIRTWPYRRNDPVNSKLTRALPILRFLLENGADPNKCGRDATSPLLQAVKFDCSDAVQILLEYNADVNHRGPDGMTALHLCYKKPRRLSGT